MAFNVKIGMIGLLHFVENQVESRENSDFQLGIVLPDLKGHVGKIMIGEEGDNDRQVIPIDGKRVFFKFYHSPGFEGRLNFREAALAGDVLGAIPIERIAGPGVQLDDGIVGLTPPETVRGQVFLEEGEFAVEPINPFIIKLPGNLTGASETIQFARKFFADIGDVERGIIVTESIRDANVPPQIYPIVAKPGREEVEISLSYDCEKPASENPALLAAAGQEIEDVDFRVHYSLFDERILQEIDGRLAEGRRKPAPRPVPSLVIPDQPEFAFIGLARGCNCLCEAGGRQAITVRAAFDKILEQSGTGEKVA